LQQHRHKAEAVALAGENTINITMVVAVVEAHTEVLQELG
jgi:hypothetical protein